MSYRGDFTLGSTFNLKFTTIDAGIPTSVSGAFVAAYPDNSSTEITAGLVFSSDFDSRVGLNNVQVVATSGNGYVTGSNYDIVAISGTVGGKSLVGYVVGSFSIQARSAQGGGGSSSDPWVTALPGAYTPGQAGHILASRMPTGTVLVGDKTGFSLSSPQFVDISGTITNVYNVINQVTTSGSSSDPWTTVLPGSYTASQAGSILASRQPSGAVVVSSNQDKTGYSLSSPQNFNLIGNISGTLSNVLNVTNPVTAGVVTGSVLGNVNGSVASVTSPVTVGTNNDKTSYSLSSPQNFNLIGNISGTITNVLNVVNPIASVAIVGIVTGSVGSVSNPVTVGTNNDKTGYSLSSPQSVNIIGNISGTLTNVLNVVNPVNVGSITGSVGSVTNPVTVGTNNDKTGYSLSSPQTINISGTITNVVNVINPVVVTGSVVSVTNPVTVGTNNDKAGYSLSTPQAFNLIGNISGTITNVLNPVQVTGTVTVGINNDKTGYGLATGTLLDAMADKVWDETIASHLTAGTTGEKLNAAGAAGDPWTTALPGIYVAGSAGHILASRMPTGAVIVGVNNDKTGYSLSSPQSWDLIGNISGTITNVVNLLNNVTGSTVISNADITTIASRVWDSTYSPIRTLTTSAGDSIPPAAGDDVFAIRGDTFIWDISGLDLTNVSNVQFSAKKKVNDADSESLIFSESVTGLVYIDGSAAQVPANSAITYNSTSGTARIRIEAVEMAKLDVAQGVYDIQIIRTTGTIVSSPVQGNFYITWDSSRATS